MHIINLDHAIGFIAGIIYLFLGIFLILLVEDKTERISNIIGDSVSLATLFWLFWWLVVPIVFLPLHKRQRPFTKRR